jgi:hypothetical protein
MESTYTNKITKLEKYTIDANLKIKKPNTFEKIFVENCTYTIV